MQGKYIVLLLLYYEYNSFSMLNGYTRFHHTPHDVCAVSYLYDTLLCIKYNNRDEFNREMA